MLVVTDYAYAKYLGRLDVTFDDDGRVTDWAGNPILLNKDIEEGKLLQQEVVIYFFNHQEYALTYDHYHINVACKMSFVTVQYKPAHRS